ncbi:MAG: serpin family protein [Calditrichaeota bacterium]|nr:serpin family protein [Calditrichota bacterium]
MISRSRLWVIFILGLFLIQCDNTPISSIESPDLKNRPFTPEELQLIQSSNHFAIQLFQRLSDQEIPRQKNIFVSPLSISLALSMALNGAYGETYEAIYNTLQFQDMNLEAINTYSHSLIQLLMELDPAVEFKIANSLFYRKGFPIKSPFMQVLAKYYFAEIAALDFQSPLAMQTINNWASTQTNGMIRKIVDKISDDTMLFLINAIYFKGMWSYPFSASDTEERPFYLATGEEITVPTMYREGTVFRTQTEWGTIVDLPYGNRRFRMTIFLPEESTSLLDVIQQLTPETLTTYFQQLDSIKADLYLPKFKYTFNTTLNDILKAMGMAVAFHPDQADFSGISDKRLFISRVSHSAAVQVDEKGTEAAAVTAILFDVVSVPPVIAVNRPFLFLIRENQANTIIFMGVVMNPAS